MLHYQESKEEVLKAVASSLSGLSSGEAKKRQKIYGKNKLSEENKRSPLSLFLLQYTDPLVLILIGATFIALLVGEHLDAAIIGFIVLFNGILGFVQDWKAEQALQALKNMLAPQARVKRDGIITMIPAEDLVPGDILYLEEGDKVPADARIIEGDFLVDESMLTGESIAVEKNPQTLKKILPLGEQKNLLFSGTTIVKGHGIGVVIAIGQKTEVGKIAQMIQEQPNQMTPLQRQLADFGKKLGMAIIGIGLVIFGIEAMTTHHYFQSLMIALSLAVAAVPQALPAVITIGLSLGVKRMVKKHALVRRLPAVETLGNVDIICTDKTGTLTKNEMKVEYYFVDRNVIALTTERKQKEKKHEFSPEYLLFLIGAVCNNATLTPKYGDPTEIALLESASKMLGEVSFQKQWQRIVELSFDSQRKMMSVVVKNRGKYYLFTKGAPDVLVTKSTTILEGKKGKLVRLTKRKRQQIQHAQDEFTQKTYRVLGFAYRPLKQKEITAYLRKKEPAILEKDLIFIGLQAMRDPPREEVKKSVAEAQAAGINVMMITGDYLATAKAIGKAIGITGKAIEGKTLDQWDENILTKKIPQISIIARASPEHKLRVVKALQKNGMRVAMTGDGVNDAPALKKADIGVAMGSGTEVAKEASDLILLDDRFTTIVEAVKEGRLIYANIKKFLAFLLYSNSIEVLVILLGTLINPQALPFLAIHLLWINLLTDGLPALALSVDPPEKELMQQPPAKEHSFLTKQFLINNALIASTVTILLLVLFYSFLPQGVQKAQTISFTAMVLYEMMILYLVRQQGSIGFFSNKWLTLAVASTLGLQVLVLYGLNEWFHTVPLGKEWGVILFSAALVYGINRLVMKFFASWETKQLKQRKHP